MGSRDGTPEPATADLSDTEWRVRAEYGFWPRLTVLAIEGDRTVRLRRDSGEELEATITMPSPGC